MAKVDINTKMITLLGDPLKQSFAAQMQNCGYEAAGLNIKDLNLSENKFVVIGKGNKERTCYLCRFCSNKAK